MTEEDAIEGAMTDWDVGLPYSMCDDVFYVLGLARRSRDLWWNFYHTRINY